MVTAVVIVVAIVVLGLWLAARPPKPMIQGMVDTDQIQVAAKVPGRLEAVMVHEGDRVKAGQLLFVLSSPELDAKLAQVQAQQVAAESQAAKARHGAQSEDIQSARSAWQASEANAALAARTVTRVANLYAEGVVSLQRRDEAVAMAKATANAAAAAKAQYEKALGGARPEDIKSAESLASQAEAGVREVAALQAELRITAPVAGEISRRNANVGEVVPPTLPVISMFEPDKLWVSLNVRENQFHGLRIGQELSGTVPALNDKRLRFKVYYIAPLGDFATWRATRESSGYDIKTFEVRVRPDNAPPELRPGMSVLFDWPT
ncbi:HlyD family efflux transporter periplasmic adaptor subunit [Dyella terrae]|uniref:HlyD family efflux transporter periplasmic adaptor subunit n=2 Tax=Dyella TaxID=231454 RepID=A0A4R0Z5V6_9GAMM|nr:HlyD family efflux transporter periplasmic adaptor subunit [Dyella terrae]TCI13830.1 HlyD family efflux transporter periplasmic adaptor subunit [Dyella soli]